MASIAPQDITNILAPGEQVQLYIKQKIYHPKINIDAIAFTNQRIILRHPKDLALRKDYTDYSYADVANAIIDHGLLRSTIRCILRFGGEPLILGNIANAEADRAYSIIHSNIARYQTPFITQPSTYPQYGRPQTAWSQQTPQGSAGSFTGTNTGATARCSKCNTPALAGARFCASCGAPLGPTSIPSPA